MKNLKTKKIDPGSERVRKIILKLFTKLLQFLQMFEQTMGVGLFVLCAYDKTEKFGGQASVSFESIFYNNVLASYSIR